MEYSNRLHGAQAGVELAEKDPDNRAEAHQGRNNYNGDEETICGLFDFLWLNTHY
jgi:hypothetical protein